MKRIWGQIAALGAVLAAALLAAPAAGAATVTVNTNVDEFGGGAGCALREAIEATNLQSAFGGCPAGARPDEIVLPAGTYKLTIAGQDMSLAENSLGDLDFTPGTDVVVQGAGAPSTVIELSGDHGVTGDRVIDAVGGSTTVVGATIRGGNTNGLDGGGVRVQSGAFLGLVDSAVSGNRAGGSANGGGIYSQGGVLALTRSLVAENSTSGDGGGVFVLSGTPSIANSTISSNAAAGDGGGLALVAGAAYLANATIAVNRADDDAASGGGGGGLFNGGGTVNLRDSVLAMNTDRSPGGAAAPDCSGPIASGGGNVLGSGVGCAFAAGAADATSVEARLGTFADNGGPTWTHPLLAQSPAIGRAAACPPVDQRGAPRTDCDSGAYELVTCKRVVVNRVGTAGNNELRGTAGPDGILALGGKDVLRGLAGKDGLCGGAGRDRLIGGKGGDRLAGQGGKDVCKGGGGHDRAKGCERERGVP